MDGMQSEIEIEDESSDEEIYYVHVNKPHLPEVVNVDEEADGPNLLGGLILQHLNHEMRQSRRGLPKQQWDIPDEGCIKIDDDK